MNLKKGKLLGAILLSIFVLSSCKSLKNTNTLFQSKYDKFADTAKSVYVANRNPSDTENNYKIQPFDLIALRNLQDPAGLVNLSPTEGVKNAAIFRVDKNGIVDFPVIGPMTISGLTQAEAASKLQEAYGKSLLKNPIIEFTIVNYKVTLLGDVPKPGNYKLDGENMNLIDLLGESSGFLPSSNARTIKIIRGDRKNPEIIYINLNEITSLASDKLILQNNDIIYVSQKGLYRTASNFKVFVDVIQPTMVIFNALILLYTLKKL